MKYDNLVALNPEYPLYHSSVSRFICSSVFPGSAKHTKPVHKIEADGAGSPLVLIP